MARRFKGRWSGTLRTFCLCTSCGESGLKTVHNEAGLRSFDHTMPNEINRILTNTIGDILFVTEQSGLANLKHEGIDGTKVHFIGNVTIDTLEFYKEKAASHALRKIKPKVIAEKMSKLAESLRKVRKEV